MVDGPPRFNKYHSNNYFCRPLPLENYISGAGGGRRGEGGENVISTGVGVGGNLFSSPSIYIIIYYKDHEFPALSQSLGVLGNLLAEGFRDYIII